MEGKKVCPVKADLAHDYQEKRGLYSFLTLSGPSFQINVRSGGAGGQYCPPRICIFLTQLVLTKNFFL